MRRSGGYVIDDNAADENLYKLFGEMSVIQYTSGKIIYAT